MTTDIDIWLGRAVLYGLAAVALVLIVRRETALMRRTTQRAIDEARARALATPPLPPELFVLPPSLPPIDWDALDAQIAEADKAEAADNPAGPAKAG